MKLGEMTLNEVGKKLIVPFVFCVTAVILAPPDIITQIFLAVEMLIIYGIVWFIVSRFKSYAQTPRDVKKLIIVMMCLFSITLTTSIHFFLCYSSLQNRQLETEQSNSPVSQEQTQMESQ